MIGYPWENFKPSRYLNRMGGGKVKGINMKGMWDREISICDDDATFTQNKLRFIQNSSADAITFSKKYNVRVRPQELLSSIRDCLSSTTRVASPYHNSFIIEGVLNGEDILISLSCRDKSEEDWEGGMPYIGGRTERDSVDGIAKGRNVVSYFVEATGTEQVLNGFFTAIDTIYTKENLAQVRWWYKDEHRPTYKTVFINPVKTHLHPEFYPSVAGGPQQYLKDYLEADASVLLVAGPPGTGKTTLLRHLISDFKLAAHIVYDEEIMKSDSVFQSFLFSEESDILIVEDADRILEARESGENKLMARFLSVADGLIKLPNKKLVFTTNIHDFTRIDPALLREGRCHDLLKTTELTYPQAKQAATVAGLPIPLKNKDYTLAALFNQSRAEIKVRTAGFLG